MLINEINLIKDKFVIKNIKIENIDSKIITKTEEIKLIEDRIKNDETFKNKTLRYELIFEVLEIGEILPSFMRNLMVFLIPFL